MGDRKKEKSSTNYPNDSLIVDGEWTVGGEDLVFTDVAIQWCAVLVGRLHSDNFTIESTFVNLSYLHEEARNNRATRRERPK